MSESILSIEQVAERTPWSRSTLYRIASREDSPFRKVAGRWVTTEGDLVDWVRRSPKPQRAKAENPMPRRGSQDFVGRVIELRKGA